MTSDDQKCPSEACLTRPETPGDVQKGSGSRPGASWRRPETPRGGPEAPWKSSDGLLTADLRPLGDVKRRPGDVKRRPGSRLEASGAPWPVPATSENAFLTLSFESRPCFSRQTWPEARSGPSQPRPRDLTPHVRRSLQGKTSPSLLQCRSSVRVMCCYLTCPCYPITFSLSYLTPFHLI